MPAAVVGVYLWSLNAGHPDDVIRSLSVATLVVGSLSLILVNRTWRLPVWSTFRERRTLKWVVGGADLLLVVLLNVPVLRSAFDLGPLAPGDWALAVVAGAAGVAWFEIYTTVRRP